MNHHTIEFHQKCHQKVISFNKSMNSKTILDGTQLKAKLIVIFEKQKIFEMKYLKT